MSTDLTRLDLRLRRRSAAAYTIGLAGYTFLIVALYPTFKHDSGIDQLTKSNPTLSALFGASGSLTSPAGWMNANLFANFLPLFALLMTIGYGAAAIAGQDEDGTLGEIASLPVDREHLLVQKVLALWVLSLPIPVVCAVVTAAGHGYGIHLPVSALIHVTLTASLMAFDFGMVALSIGAWTGSRGTALGVTAAVAAAAYLISSLAPVVHAIHQVRYLSPMYWGVGADQIHNGGTIAQAMLLLLLGAGTFVAAQIGARRLDIH